METMNGMFRGICVDNRDPKNLGRIRVQVPQMLGVSASGWAFPAWSFHQKMIWPQDRLPNPGDGVWVMFDSTSPDKMIWVAAFGSLDLINQPEFVEAPDYKGTLTMILTGTPTWNTVVTFSGVLDSDLGGVPNPNPTVVVTGRQKVVGGDWISLGSTSPDPITGAWSLSHLIRLTGEVEYRANFPGVGVYGEAISEVVTVNTPVVTFPTSLSLSITGTPAFNGPVTLSGTLLATGSPPPGYEVPNPGATVNVNCRTVGSSSWQAAASNIAVNEANGAWTAPYTISLPGAVEYQAVFSGLDVFLASASSITTVDTSVGTTVSTPALPALWHGSGFNVSGTIKVAGTGANVTSGVAELWWRYTMGGDQAWKKSSVSQTITAGSYSLTHPALSTLGSTQWQVRYVGTTKYDPANSSAVSGTINLPGNGALTKGAISHTSAAFSWAAVSGATSYDVERWNGSAWIPLGSNTSRSYTDSTLAANGQYWWRVRPKATNVAGTTVYGGYSATITMTTGRPAQTATGTSGWISISSVSLDCHRKDTGWQNAGEARQGYFSSSYGGDGYIGVIHYGSTAIKNAVKDAVGQSAFDNGSCADARVTLYRTTTGTVGSATVSFYVTTGGTSGARPVLQGSRVNVAASGYSASKTYTIGTGLGNLLGKGTVGGIAIYRNDSSNYLGLSKAGTNGGKLELKWTWNYTSVTYIAPTWV